MLLLTPSKGLGGGIERYVAAIEAALRRHHTVHRIDLHGGESPFRRVTFVAKALAAAVAWRPDVILCMHMDLMPVRKALKLLTTAPVVLWIYGGEVFSTANRRIFARHARSVAAIVTISAFTADQIARAGGSDRPVRIIRPALSDEWLGKVGAIQAEKTTFPSVVALTRFGPEIEEKGIPILMDVAGELRRRYPALELWLVGAGPRLSEMQERARDRGYGDWCRFFGHRPDEEVIATFKSAWVFALPSRLDEALGRGEGFGLVYTEAASAGLPVVGSTHGGAAEAVRHDVNGVVVDPMDADAITGACARLLDDAQLRHRMGQAGVAWVESEFRARRLEAEVDALMEALAEASIRRKR